MDQDKVVLVSVTFVESASPYHPPDVAGFPKHEADAYVKSGKVNATIPKGTAPEDMTLEAALPLIAARAAAAPKGKAKATTAKKAPAKKAAAKKPAAKKKAPAKKKAE